VAGYIEYAKNSAQAEGIAGGGRDDSRRYFVEPTIIVTKNAKSKTIQEEIFGPVLTDVFMQMESLRKRCCFAFRRRSAHVMLLMLEFFGPRVCKVSL